MSTKYGNLSINSENIFPIIKKWMYSDKDIFVREMISNASDAITKRKKLSLAGECELPEDFKPRIDVICDDKERTLKFIDNGLGMTGDEVEKYIAQIAFSGAAEFLEKYKDKADSDQIIGHFGLGFFSAFMVAKEVAIDTLSYQEGAVPVHWSCDGGTEYEMEDGDRTEVGTTITLFLNEDSYEFSNEYQVRETLEKYCSFIPYEIYLKKEGAAPVMEKDADGNEVEKAPTPINDISPLFTRRPNDCTDEEYKAFYRKVFNDYKEPLFWIHLNMDYPFNLKGILYFPRINTEYDSIEGTIKLYNNQVFIADNIKEVIPEYLLLLKGVIDCPDLPLNVSRSALQNDGFVTKISDYISKKVADKLSGMCKVTREDYEKYWDDIQPFVKYGCLKDSKFADKMMEFILYKDLDNKYFTISELMKEEGIEEETAEAAEGETAEAGTAGEAKGETAEAGTAGEAEGETAEAGTAGEAEGETAEAKEAAEGETAGENAEAEGAADAGKDSGADAAEAVDSDEEAEEKRHDIYYVTDPVRQSQYINMFKEEGKRAVVFRHTIDMSFISLVEDKNDKVHFRRIDSGIDEDLIGGAEISEEDAKELEEIFRKAVGNNELTVKTENLKNETLASVVTFTEEERRMQEMMKLYGMSDDEIGAMAAKPTLVLNRKHPLVSYIAEHKKSKNAQLVASQLYDLAMLQNRPLKPDEMTRFIERSNELMMKVLK